MLNLLQGFLHRLERKMSLHWICFLWININLSLHGTSGSSWKRTIKNQILKLFIILALLLLWWKCAFSNIFKGQPITGGLRHIRWKTHHQNCHNIGSTIGLICHLFHRVTDCKVTSNSISCYHCHTSYLSYYLPGQIFKANKFRRNCEIYENS